MIGGLCQRPADRGEPRYVRAVGVALAVVVGGGRFLVAVERHDLERHVAGSEIVDDVGLDIGEAADTYFYAGQFECTGDTKVTADQQSLARRN